MGGKILKVMMLLLPQQEDDDFNSCYWITDDLFAASETNIRKRELFF